jgi:hypothetical protein
MINAKMAKISMIHKATDICFVLPAATCNKVQLKNPQIMPCVMEYVNGIKTIAIKAGMASSNCIQLIFMMGFIIKTPTNTNAGAVAIAGTALTNGDKNKNGKNNI